MNGGIDWTEPMVAMLTTQIAAGLSGALIARNLTAAFGVFVNKNMVIGKKHRLHLLAPPKERLGRMPRRPRSGKVALVHNPPPKPARPQTPPIAPKTMAWIMDALATGESAEAVGRRIGIDAWRTCKIRSDAVKAGAVFQKWSEFRRNGYFHPLPVVVAEEVAVPLVAMMLAAAPVVAVPVEWHRVPDRVVVFRSHLDCQYLHGDDRRSYRQCEAVAVRGAYCAEHAGRCYKAKVAA